MNFEDIILRYGIHLGTFLVCLISGFIPVINAEIYLIWVATIVPQSDLGWITFWATLGQMTTKSMMYFGGNGLIRLPMTKYKVKLEAVQQKLLQWEHHTNALIFFSGSVGFPPFYLVSIAAGGLKKRFVNFFIFGFLGRFIRFSVFVFFPYFVKGWVT